MSKPIIVQVIESMRVGSGASIEVRLEHDRVVLLLYMPGQAPRQYAFTGEQAKRIGDALSTAAARLEIKLV